MLDGEQYKNLKVAVTGGAGFIGSHLVEKLLALGAEVTVIDNLLHGNKLEHLKQHDNPFIYQGDIRDTGVLLEALRGKELVFHLAAVVGVEETQDTPCEVLDVEILGTINVLKLAVDAGIRRVVFASSSEVYGDSLKPMKEEAPVSPKSTYAVAKLVGEHYCQAYRQKYDLDYTCLRYFNVYGPRQDERFVISRFVNRGASREPILIYGDGEQTRDFTYIDDAVDMTLLSGIKPEARCQVINVGTGVATTINGLADLITQIMDSKSPTELIHVDYDSKRPRGIEVFSRIADNGKARQLLHYEPRTPLALGIRKYIDWNLERERRAL